MQHLGLVDQGCKVAERCMSWESWDFFRLLHWGYLVPISVVEFFLHLFNWVAKWTHQLTCLEVAFFKNVYFHFFVVVLVFKASKEICLVFLDNHVQPFKNQTNCIFLKRCPFIWKEITRGIYWLSYNWRSCRTHISLWFRGGWLV